MTYVIARAVVDDFEEWKAAFDDNTDARLEHGCKRFTVLRGIEDTDHVSVVMEFDTEASARSWVDYVDEEDTLAEAGMHDTVLTVFDEVEDWAEAPVTA